jgi:hypothetical protein
MIDRKPSTALVSRNRQRSTVNSGAVVSRKHVAIDRKLPTKTQF